MRLALGGKITTKVSEYPHIFNVSLFLGGHFWLEGLGGLIASTTIFLYSCIARYAR
jgi:hypothetical protein